MIRLAALLLIVLISLNTAVAGTIKNSSENFEEIVAVMKLRFEKHAFAKASKVKQNIYLGRLKAYKHHEHSVTFSGIYSPEQSNIVLFEDAMDNGAQGYILVVHSPDRDRDIKEFAKLFIEDLEPNDTVKLYFGEIDRNASAEDVMKNSNLISLDLSIPSRPKHKANGAVQHCSLEPQSAEHGDICAALALEFEPTQDSIAKAHVLRARKKAQGDDGPIFSTKLFKKQAKKGCATASSNLVFAEGSLKLRSKDLITINGDKVKNLKANLFAVNTGADAMSMQAQLKGKKFKDSKLNVVVPISDTINNLENLSELRENASMEIIINGESITIPISELEIARCGDEALMEANINNNGTKGKLSIEFAALDELEKQLVN